MAKMTLKQAAKIAAKVKPSQWTWTHRREARRRLGELMGRIEGEYEANGFVRDIEYGSCSATRFLYVLMSAFEPERALRELRRVRAIAEGRLVRSTIWEVRIAPSSVRLARFFEEDVARRSFEKCDGYWKRHQNLVRIDRLRPLGPAAVYMDPTLVVEGDGTLERPFRELFDAIDAVRSGGDVIVVVKGEAAKGNSITVDGLELPMTRKPFTLRVMRQVPAPREGPALSVFVG
jgi:hypothetical protein